STGHPILAQVVPIRRCNLSCAYCNEFDKTSEPVAVSVMMRRIDRLAELGTSIITFSGGGASPPPPPHILFPPVRAHNAICTLITNGYFLTPERIRGLNHAGLDYLQISIDNINPDSVSKKSLKVLDRKLQWLAEYAEFDITINSVLGSDAHRPEDAFEITERARCLGFTSTVGVLHDEKGQLQSLNSEQRGVYNRIFGLGGGLFTFAHLDVFQRNLINGLPNDWHCAAGGRFLYICEDGLVHYCSQQRGRPGIPLDDYRRNDIVRESAVRKGCAPFCTISCVHQTAMLDSFRERPRETLTGIVKRRQARDSTWQAPASVRLLEWMFLRDAKRGDWLGAFALRLLRTERSSLNRATPPTNPTNPSADL